jgi:hypothetical protein
LRGGLDADGNVVAWDVEQHMEERGFKARGLAFGFYFIASGPE